MDCHFGRHQIRFLLDPDAGIELPSYWQRFTGAVITDAAAPCVAVSECEPESCFPHHDHWEHTDCQAEIRTTFYRNRRSVFSLQYGADRKRITVLRQTDSDRTVIAGMQYAAMLALADTCIGLHCVTVICGDQAIALSAPSGTGKSTLAKLLVKYGDAAIVNGDFALLSCDPQAGVIFEPTPFCGTSQICFNARVPISRIVYLEQGDRDRFTHLSGRQHLQRLMSNVFVPEWDACAAETIRQTAVQIVERVPASVYAFTPTKEAVDCFYHTLISMNESS